MKKRRRNEDQSAFALHYDQEGAPRVTAKGRGDLAEEIIRLAEEHGIPLHQDAELSRLLAQIDLGDEIPRELYIAVAEVLAFAFIVTGRFPPGWEHHPKNPDAQDEIPDR